MGLQKILLLQVPINFYIELLTEVRTHGSSSEEVELINGRYGRSFSLRVQVLQSTPGRQKSLVSRGYDER
jgi:hypothetical protein